MIPFARMLQYGNINHISVKKMEFGSQHYVLLDSTGKLYGAGTNNVRQYSPNPVATGAEWVLIDTGVDDCWAGGTWTCYRKGGIIYYIGANGLSSTSVTTYTPISSAQLGTVNMADISAIYGTVGMMHFVTSNNNVYAIGANSNANSGLNTASTAISKLTLVSGFTGSPKRISYAVDGTVLLHMGDNGYMYGWGKNSSGMLANANQTAVGVPKLISFGAVGAFMGYTSLSYMAASGLWSCGDQVYGQTGTNYTTGSNSYLTSIKQAAYTGSKIAPLIASKGSRNTWNNSFISTEGVWVTGINPQTLGYGSTETLGVYTLVPSPVQVDDIIDYGVMASVSTICSGTAIYQCGSGSRIIGVGTGSVVGFTRVPLPWE